MVKATPSTPEAFAFIGKMLTAAGYRLAAVRRSSAGRRGRYLRRTFVRPVNDRYHLEVWQYVNEATGQVLFMDLSLWSNDDMASGRAVRYKPVRTDLTDVVTTFSDERTGIGTISREWTSKASGVVKRLAYSIPDDVRKLGFDDNGGTSHRAPKLSECEFWTRPRKVDVRPA